MTAVLLSSLPVGILIDDTGNALSGRPVFVYLRGTTQQVPVFADVGMTVPMVQPLITGSTAGSPEGGVPGYVQGEQSIDLVDSLTGARTQAEVVSAADIAARIASIGIFESDALGPMGPSQTLDFSTLGQNVMVTGTLTADCTLTLKNFANGGQVFLILTEDSVGNHALTVTDGITSQVVPIFSAAGNVSVVQAVSPNGTDVYLSLMGIPQPTALVEDTSAVSGSPIEATNVGNGRVNQALRDWRSVYNYNVVGNGTSDDTAALLAATNECRNQGKKLYIPYGTFLVSGPITDPLNNNALSLEGSDPGVARIKQGANFSANPIVTLHGNDPSNPGTGFGTLRTVTNPVAAGQTVITGISSTTDANGTWKQNDMILIRANDQTIQGNSAGPGTYGTCAVLGEWAKIKSVDSTSQVTVYGRLEFSYNANNTDIRKLYAINARIAHLGFFNSTPGAQTTSAARCIQLNFFNGVDLIDLAFTDFDADMIQLQQGVDFRIIEPRFLQGHDLEFVGSDLNPYCIEAAKATHNGLIVNPISRYGRHMFTTGAPSATDVGAAWIEVHGGAATEHSQAGYDVHPGGRRITFYNPTVHNQYPGTPAIQLRGPECAVYHPNLLQADIGVLLVFGADRGRVLGGWTEGCDIGIQIQDSDDVELGGGLLIQSPATTGILFHSHDAGWPPGSPSKFYCDDVRITGNPSDAAIDFQSNVWSSPGFRLGSGILIPDAANKIVGMAEPTIATTSTLVVPV